MTALSIQTYRGEYAVLQAALPERPVANIGVLLLDPSSRKLYSKLREFFGDVANPDEAEVLSELREDFAKRLEEIDGEEFLIWLEDTLSNVLRVTERQTVMVRDFNKTLDKLFAEHVEMEKPATIPYQNCLPLLAMPVAAGYLDRQAEIVEAAAEWVPVPDSFHPNPRKFIARIQGRSMEPKIPDGSLAVFRFGVVGSRTGRILLVELFDVADPIARYTVKKYLSDKASFDGTWRHTRILLVPINPEFEPIEVEEEGQFRVIAEFEGVLDTDG